MNIVIDSTDIHDKLSLDLCIPNPSFLQLLLIYK
jgi:hypothetical protein